MYNINFISENDFETHVKKTLLQYKKNMNAINLKKFNSNIIDPIKLIFDKNIFDKSYKDIISYEIHRQRDKSNSNAIGYFHQNIFRYFKNCKVPKQGWDVIFKDEEGLIYYVELKNKHNTMNSSASEKTFSRMQNQLLTNNNEGEQCICALVEVISKFSGNRTWELSINKQRMKNDKIRRISIDCFYDIVTGEKDAFYQICNQLPVTIGKLIEKDITLTAESDTVYQELQGLNKDELKSLYLLAFSDYEGFKDLNDFISLF